MPLVAAPGASSLLQALASAEAHESSAPTGKANRLFYFAIPPEMFVPAAKSIHAAGKSATGWTRMVIEKPFGSDFDSSAALSAELAKYFTEDQVRQAACSGQRVDGRGGGRRVGTQHGSSAPHVSGSATGCVY